MKDKKTQGKKNRQAGARFELKVRKDLEKKGWIVSKWFNNVEIIETPRREFTTSDLNPKGYIVNCRLIPARHKFRGVGMPMSLGTGFPDFIAFRIHTFLQNEYTKEINCDFVNDKILTQTDEGYWRGHQVIGVEARSNGCLTKEEKLKCKWLLDNNIFSRILIAKKGKKRGEIIYEDYMEK